MVEQDVILESIIICNKCGSEYKRDDRYEIHIDQNNNELHNFNCSFGYFSDYDGEVWDFDLCQDCLVDMVKTFKVIPDGFMNDNYVSHLEKDKQLCFDLWKSTGKWESFTNYTAEELEELREYFEDEYIDELIVKCKNGQLEY